MATLSKAVTASVGSPDWKQVWLDSYPCDMPTTIPYPQAPLTALLETAARRFPDRPGCTLYGLSTTFAQLDDQARRLARALADLGARPGRHVGLLLPNIPEYLVALQAVWLTGATALQLSPLMVAEEVGHWLEATGCHIVVTLDLLAPAVVGALDHGPLEHLVLTSLARRMAMWRGMIYRIERLRRNGYLRLPHDAHRHRFDELVQGEALTEAVAVDPIQDVAVLAPTGGTTASPKAVMLTHRNLLANALQLRSYCPGDDGEGGVLGVLPFFHAYGLSVALLTSWAKGSTLHLHPRFEARQVLALVEEQRPDIVPAVPAMLGALNKVMRGRPHDLSFIQMALSGASALEPNVRREFESYGVSNVVEGYGLTEASPVTHANPLGAGNRPGTIGLPLPDTEARLADPDSGAAIQDGMGELVVRGPQVMKGYFNNAKATQAVLKDGWLYTGDIARRDADGYSTIVDRKRDIIKTSGFLVFPAEVEEVIRAFPGVAEAAVIGAPDSERGELVKALVVPRGDVKLDAAALEAHCRLHLSKHKRPRHFEVVGELPKNFLGKVLRRKLREPTPTLPGLAPAAS
jgi:long-chain acyl-CoA synthetase